MSGSFTLLRLVSRQYTPCFHSIEVSRRFSFIATGDAIRQNVNGVRLLVFDSVFIRKQFDVCFGFFQNFRLSFRLTVTKMNHHRDGCGILKSVQFGVGSFRKPFFDYPGKYFGITFFNMLLKYHNMKCIII